MSTKQYEITLSPKPYGVHLITSDIINAVIDWPEIGIAQLFLQHTSAAITINENADPTVREDMQGFINRLVPDNLPFYKHIYEGADDMHAHIKSSLFVVHLTLPIKNKNLAMGTWQGIYLMEFRKHAGRRKLILTILS
ncbi:MAG: YjbQ family protein [Bacteroidales bacterium]|nr:YjbQ family protein [Bacteroidales bacterium]